MTRRRTLDHGVPGLHVGIVGTDQTGRRRPLRSRKEIDHTKPILELEVQELAETASN